VDVSRVRRRSVRLPIPIALFVTWTLGGGLAAGAEMPARYHSLVSEGLVALAQQDPESALYLFDLALFEYSEGAVARYYRGVALAQLELDAEAEASFQTALSLDPTFLPASLDLAILYYDQGRDEEAVALLNGIQQIDPDRAQVYYYQGLILLRAGRAEEAAARLERAAVLDPGMAVLARYHAADAYFRAGNKEAAHRALEDVIALAPGTDAAEMANEWLVRGPAGAGSRRWDLRASIGYQRDDNVILEPRSGLPPPPGITDRGDNVVVAQAQIRYRMADGDPWITRGEYRFYQNFHQDEGEEGGQFGLRDFNIQDHGLLLDLGGATGPMELTLRYNGQWATMGGETYVLRHAVGPRLLLKETDRNRTELLYQYGVSDYHNTSLFSANDDRDAQGHLARVAHYVFFSPTGYVSGGYEFERETAGSSPSEDDWTFTAHHVPLAVVWPLGRVTVTAQAEYVRRLFSHANEAQPGTKRRDNELIAGTALALSLARYAELSVHYLHQQNDSNINVFEFSRNVYGGLLTFRY